MPNGRSGFVRARQRHRMVSALMALPFFGCLHAADGILIDCDFPAGNIISEKIDGDDVMLRQDRRDTEGWWFYWYFRIKNAAGRRLYFKFTDGSPVGVRGPAFSTDEGSSWKWLGAETSTTNAFTYQFPNDAQSIRFSFGMPYTESNLRDFLKRFSKNPALRVGTLCRSRRGRPVEFLKIARPDGTPSRRVFITGRHHCCEMMASYVIEGIMESALAEDQTGQWLREHAEFGIVPFVDKDGVEEGDQGKNRRPHDHNRDYDEPGIYPETRAIRAQLPVWSDGRPLVTMDIHCPSIRGESNERIYQVGKEGAGQWSRQQEFGRVLEDALLGPLPYKATNDLPFGQKWNTRQNYAAGTSFAQWARTVPGIWLATSFEIPYANASGAEVNTDTARAFGRDLARALHRYLQQIPES